MKWKVNVVAISMRAARVNACLTLEEAAKELGITKNTLISYETGKVSPRIETAKRMAELYDIPMNDINFFAL